MSEWMTDYRSQCERLDAEITRLRAELAAERERSKRAEQERDNWIETAKQESRNVEWYRTLIDSIGMMFGEAAKTCDDGTVSDSILRSKVPELVKAERERSDALAAALERVRREAVAEAAKIIRRGIKAMEREVWDAGETDQEWLTAARQYLSILKLEQEIEAESRAAELRKEWE